MGSGHLMRRVNFEGVGRPIVKYRDTAVMSAKTAEPFGLSAPMGPRNHLLDGDPQVLRDVAMKTDLL